jgi:NAD(P)-dependent dehydrogenase (short-subunit alcohol dehydrogenase family)
MQKIEGHTATVIGGGGGVGSGIAIALAKAGVNVVVGDILAESAEATAAAITATGGRAVPAAVDSTSEESLTDFYQQAVREFGSLEILSNQCGVILDEPVATATDADWAWFWEFNVMTMIRSVRVALPHLRKAAAGHIVTTASMAGVLALPSSLTGGVNTGLYTTTKHAVVGYSDMLRAELDPENIGVTVLCPGLVEGDLGRTSALNRPERFGGSSHPVPASGRMPPGAMSREDAGAAVVDAIHSNRAYCFTHPEVAPMLTRRFEARMADADAARNDQESRRT